MAFGTSFFLYNPEGVPSGFPVIRGTINPPTRDYNPKSGKVERPVVISEEIDSSLVTPGSVSAVISIPSSREVSNAKSVANNVPVTVESFPLERIPDAELGSLEMGRFSKRNIDDLVLIRSKDFYRSNRIKIPLAGRNRAFGDLPISPRRIHYMGDSDTLGYYDTGMGWPDNSLEGFFDTIKHLATPWKKELWKGKFFKESKAGRFIGRTVIGAAAGFVVGGPVGAVAGAATGFIGGSPTKVSKRLTYGAAAGAVGTVGYSLVTGSAPGGLIGVGYQAVAGSGTSSSAAVATKAAAATTSTTSTTAAAAGGTTWYGTLLSTVGKLLLGGSAAKVPSASEQQVVSEGQLIPGTTQYYGEGSLTTSPYSSTVSSPIYSGGGSGLGPSITELTPTEGEISPIAAKTGFLGISTSAWIAISSVLGTGLVLMKYMKETDKKKLRTANAY